MKSLQKNVKMLLLKGKFILPFLAFSLFLIVMFLPSNSNSAGFEYENFNWDEFAEANKNYWDLYCANETGHDIEDCQSTILASQEKFYKKLYKILAKYKKQGFFIDDNIILQTVFFELSPSQFSDNGLEYKEVYDSKNGAYIIDESDLEEPNIIVDFNENMAEYFSNENDTLKTLIANMIAYETSCYGIYGDISVTQAPDGSTTNSCSSGTPMDIKGVGVKCADKLATNELGFWEYFVSKLEHSVAGYNPIIKFLGMIVKDEDYESCSQYGSDYQGGSVYVYDNNPHVSTDKYFDFLSYNSYFDNKAHLQHYFLSKVLEPAGVDCMTNAVCSNSLENANKYDDYSAEIVEVRRQIVYYIIDILNNYGIEISYNNANIEEYTSVIDTEFIRSNYYFPIGSKTTTNQNGIMFASNEPASTKIISYYGVRTNSVTNGEEFHYGIDIEGIENETNVIATYDGEVVSIVSNCSIGDYDCNDGLGNMIILSHANGDYTLYASMSSIDSNIMMGSSVLRGQIIGHVGSSGKTNTPILHFEIRVGGNLISFSEDPLKYISASNPRPKDITGNFPIQFTSLTKSEFTTKLRSYCNIHVCKDNYLKMLNYFVPKAEEIYDASERYGVNPELVVVRAIKEGFSPGVNYNYWGIGASNENNNSRKYNSLSEGIGGFANIAKKHSTLPDMMKSYVSIGKYWYNPGNPGLGGCYYYKYINKYMSATRASEVASYCEETSTKACSVEDKSNCVKTISEDQMAYASWQVETMIKVRYNIFGL